MTVTDEDRKAAERSALVMGQPFTCFDCADRLAEVIADTRQAAYAAGLERAAVIMEGEAKTLYRIAHMNLPAYSPTVARDRAQYCEGMADAIRAEKDKL